jgi:hypothetical protein
MRREIRLFDLALLPVLPIIVRKNNHAILVA